MKNRFDEAAKEWDTPERTKKAKEIADILIEKYKITRNFNLFELGTGTGILSFILSEYANKITASDSSDGMLTVLKNKIEKSKIENIIPLRFDIEKDIEIFEKYDIVYSTMVMHHISDITDAAQKIYQITKNNGKIAIIDLLKENGDFHNDNTGVKHFGFTEEEIIGSFNKAGFKNLCFEILYKMKKSIKNGEVKEFPVFILYGEK